MNYELLEHAAKGKKIAPSEVVEALIAVEKNNKSTKVSYGFSELIGTWRLFFITGTKKTRKRAGIVLGAGRYLPKFISIKLTYVDKRVENEVTLGSLKLTVTGPIKFIEGKNILVFDFTEIFVELLGKKIYQSYLGNGKEREKNFWEESIKTQAFFTYFLINKKIIAARGKGGGLALWCKDNER